MENDKKAVFLPADLYLKAKEISEELGFSSVDDYIVLIMEEATKENAFGNENAFNEKEEEEARKRLKALGYLE